MNAAAVIDETQMYRYSLSRKWADGEQVTWIMLNPSTADALIDDPTIRRCIAFSKSWGYGGLHVVNIFAFRATNPKALRSAVDPFGPSNARYVFEAMRNEQRVAAWGCSPLPVPTIIQSLLAEYRMMCLGKTKEGHPRHPLYVRGDTVLQPFAPPAEQEG